MPNSTCTLYAALNESEALSEAFERVLMDLPETDPLAPFLVNTVQPSLNEYNARLNEVYSGRAEDPSFSGQLTRTETANVYGDTVEVGWTEAGYSFTYRILDQDGLTVAERDAFLQSILKGMQDCLDGPLHRNRCATRASSSRPCRPSWTGWARPPLRGRSRIPAAPWRAAGPRRPMTARVRLSPTIWSWRAWHDGTGWSLPSAPWYSLLAAPACSPSGLVRSLAPAVRLELTPPWPLSPEPYTQADLDEAWPLRTEGYEAQSVAAFDRALADWTNEAAFHAREERIRRLLCSYEEDGPEAEFVLGTLAAAMGACSARHYGGYCTQITPAYADAAAYTRSEDVFGDSYVVYEASASYTIRYQMPDESRLTVGERDRILTSYRDAVQAFLDGKTEDELSKEEAMTRALKRELKRLDQSLSTQWMALEGTRLNDYFAYGPEGGETP